MKKVDITAVEGYIEFNRVILGIFWDMVSNKINPLNQNLPITCWKYVLFESIVNDYFN
jgi:hypothetical protein